MKGSLVIAALAALQTIGCSVIVGGGVNDACVEDADCVELGFTGASCDVDKKVCVPGGGPGGQCETADECEALNANRPSICRADTKTCVELTSADCTEVAGKYKDPNAIILGFLGPLVGSDASTGIPIANGTKLALNEIEKNGPNLPGGVDGARRPLAMVYCHDLDGPEDDPWRAAKHLVNDIGVQAIVGPAFSGVTLDTTTTVTIPAGVVTMSASATSPSLTDIEDNDLVWRTCPSDALQAIPLSALLGPVEDKIRTDQMLLETDQIRVAMIVKGDAYGLGLAEEVTPRLSFNGKDSTMNGANFKRLDYGDPNAGMVDYSGILVDTIAFAPHVVLVLGTTEGVTEVFQGIEDGWPDPGPPKPYYLFPDGGKVSELTAAIGKNNDELRLRVRGTVPGGTTPLYDAFKSRYKAFIKEDPLAFADTGYDATYLYAFSIVSLGDKTVNGANIAGGLKKMISGTAFDVSPTKINTAFQALQSAGEINYNGASGPLDFDTKTGEAESNIDVWCVAYDGSGNPVFKSSGQKYDAAEKDLVGAFNCP